MTKNETVPANLEAIRKEYTDKIGNVPPNMKNNEEWLRGKIAEKTETPSSARIEPKHIEMEVKKFNFEEQVKELKIFCSKFKHVKFLLDNFEPKNIKITKQLLGNQIIGNCFIDDEAKNLNGNNTFKSYSITNINGTFQFLVRRNVNADIPSKLAEYVNNCENYIRTLADPIPKVNIVDVTGTKIGEGNIDDSLFYNNLRQ